MSGYRLYTSPGACSLGPHLLLEELGVSYEPVRVSVHAGDQRKPEYLAVNPRGRVPALAFDVEGETRVLTESVAILQFLALRHLDKGFLPRDVEQQARALEWLCWLTSSLHQAGFRLFMRPESFTTDAAGAPAIKARGVEVVRAGYADIEQRLGANAWALGADYSIVDMALLVHYRWGNRAGHAMRADFPRFAALIDKVRDRPAVARVIAAEGIEID